MPEVAGLGGERFGWVGSSWERSARAKDFYRLSRAGAIPIATLVARNCINFRGVVGCNRVSLTGHARALAPLRVGAAIVGIESPPERRPALCVSEE